MENIEAFYVIGITVRTTNQDGQSARDIPALWQRFLTECYSERIPNKVDDTIYGAYLAYEADHTAPYTAFIGCKVAALENIPAGMTGTTLGGGNYRRFIAEGRLADGIVYEQWVNIWSAGLHRCFTNDFEVYAPGLQVDEEVKIDILIAVTS